MVHMKSLVVKLIIVIVVILLLGSVGYTVLHLQSFQEQYAEEAHLHFSNLVEKSSLLYREGEERRALLSQFKETIREYGKLRSLVLYDSDGKLHYVYGRNASTLSFIAPRAEQLDRSAVRQFERPRFDTALTASFPLESGGPRSINVVAVYETLPRTALSESIKFLLLSLTGLLLILGTALLLLPSPSVPNTAGQDSFYADQSGIPQVPQEYYPPDAGFPRQSREQSETPQQSESQEQSESQPENEPPQQSGHAGTEEPAQNEASTTAEHKEEAEREESFFSEKSQLVRGDFFLSRLESELKRAASFDQDLTLLLLRCPETHSDEAFTSLAKKAKAFFTFHDLIFDLPEYTIGTILPNTDLDEGITQSSNFQKKLFEEGDARTADIRLGLSCRNGRLVEAERIYGEAQTALYKAQHDPDHPSITGFRPDPNKYRRYLSASS